MNNQSRSELYKIINLKPGILSPDNNAEIIVKYHGDLRSLRDELNVDIEILSNSYAIITTSLDNINRLFDYTEIEYIELPKILKYFLSESLYKSCIPQVHTDPIFRLSGSGVIIGIIDSGIDYTHPDFKDENGDTRILYIWDQTIDGNHPFGFRYGAEFNSVQINEALRRPQALNIVPSDDRAGHGTAISGAAAGNGMTSGGREVGVAPEASLIVVKLGGVTGNSARSTEIMRAIKYIIDKAEELAMPVSINISYGTNDGSHSGDSLFENYINSMSERWKTVIVVASGNEASAGHHFADTIQQGATTSVDFVTSGLNKSFYMTTWINFADTFIFELIAPSGKTTGEIRQTQSVSNAILDNVRISVIMIQPTQYNLSQEIFINFLALGATIPEGVWKLKIFGLKVVDGRINIWLPTIEDVSNNTAFLIPSVITTLTIPSTAIKVISVGGYNAFIGDIAAFSGRGYTRGNVYVKPDIVAPSVGVLSTRAGGGYDTFTGTSIAAPFVTGSAALMMEWGIVRGNDPFLYGQRVKAFLQKGARRDFNIEYPNPLWGYGTLCLNNSMNYLVDYAGGLIYG